MPQFPPIPPWASLHPLLVHFPIALLFLSPLFLLIGAILSPIKGRPYLIAALIVLFLGTASLFAAAESGKAAATLVGRGGPADAVMATHVDLAARSEILFSVLFVLLLGIVLLPAVLRCQQTRLTTTLMPLSFLVLYCAGLLFVMNTAYAGVRLVHQYGIHAQLPAPSGQSYASPDVQGPVHVAAWW
jgi:uncharacterized membrane protein